MSSAADPTALFLSAIRQSSLLSADQMAAFNAWAAQTKPDIQEAARELNRRRWLTPYQIKEVFKGRGKDLTLGRYVLLDLLGEGGMGRVYKAHDTRLGRDIALEVIRKEKLANPAAAARFEQEMLALGQMRPHPNVVHAFTADQVGDLHFVVMELIDGHDLTRLVREKGPMPVPDACDCIRQAALGLQHALEHGLVHRDIKPSNLILTGGTKQVKLVDLGLARLMEALGGDEAGRITQEGFVIGTPDFLAPEQARDPSGVDIRADVYSLGGTLFFLLTGKVPYEANPTEKLLKHCTEPPPRLLPLRPDAPPQLEHLMHWCMAKRPEDRPQTPLQLAMALQPFCPGGVVGSGGYPVPAAVAVPWPVLPLPDPDHDPQRSSQLFRLPEDTAAPRAARAKKKPPRASVMPLVVVLGGLFLLGLIGAGVYRHFMSGPPPVEPATNGVGMRLVKIDGGTFRMGSPDAEPGRGPDEGPVREVQVRGPFLMAATEVTHAQYLKVVGRSPPRSTPRPANPADFPADGVTYDEAVEFCQKLTEREKGQPYTRPGWAYRLPTEAEWEYACRAGTTTPYWCGDAIGPKQGTVGPESKGDRRDPDPKRLPTKAGATEANRWGLSDVSGNVAEWCADWYKPGYAGDATDNPTGPPAGDRRVVRGGSFRCRPADARSAARFGLPPGERADDVGFRVVYAPRN